MKPSKEKNPLKATLGSYWVQIYGQRKGRCVIWLLRTTYCISPGDSASAIQVLVWSALVLFIRSSEIVVKLK